MYGPTGSIGVTQEVVDYGVALRAGIGSFDYRPPEMSPPIDVAFIASGEEIPPLLKYHHDEFLRRPGKARRWPLVVTVLTDNEETLSPAMLEPKGQREMLGSLVEELRESVKER